MRWMLSPAVANRIGNSPQARPSLRLLTRPAWLTEDSDLSWKLVRVNTCRLLRVETAWAWTETWFAASTLAWWCVSFTKSTESPSPRAMKAAPSRNCLLYTSDAADDLLCVDLGGRRIIKKK